MKSPKLWIAGLAALGFTCVITPETHADGRVFTHTYETTVMTPGSSEFEQWLTWKTRKDSDKKFDRLDFRSELEFGITEDFQLAFYLDSRYQDGRGSMDDGFLDFRNIAVEGIYQLSDPIKDGLGTAIYGEVKLGKEIFELEGKFLVQKNIGKWVLAWNGILELEWEDERYHEDKMVIAQTAGASYQIDPSLAVGVELVHELERDDFAHWNKAEVYVGPTVSIRKQGWWAGITQLFQVSDVAGAPDYQTRFILGIDLD